MVRKSQASSSPPPPLILALETSGTCGSVALVDGGGCRAEHSLQSSRTHSRRLLDAVAGLMRECETDWAQLDAIAVSLGPGSFTGLRIGLSSAKGLTLATAKPLIGISSLDGLAAQGGQQPLPICALIDARKKEVFAGFYQTSPTPGDNLSKPPEAGPIGGLHRCRPFLALPPHDLAAMITEPTLLLGSGAELYRDLLQNELGPLALFAPPQLYFARAAAIGMLAQAQWRQGEFLDPARATPIYVRSSDAQLP